MRHPKELAFRLRQECADLSLWARPPELPPEVRQTTPLGPLPDPEPIAQKLRGTAFAAEVEHLAQGILQHRFPVLGTEISTGAEIDWRRDYLHNISSDARYCRLVRYLDFSHVGDHKVIWELNRQQHLVLLSQAFRLSGKPEFLSEIGRQIQSWRDQNPFMRGINWASALEVAFRALSWCWVYHLTAEAMEVSARRRLLNEIHRHGCYLEKNLSIYFSPNTHLLGEAVALHALGVLFPAFPKAARWKQLGVQLVADALEQQVQEDGTHFEQSSYYHLYALDFFLLHRVLAGGEAPARLERMAEYLETLMGPDRTLPLLGDDDRGRVFHPYGARERFGRATLATAAVLLRRPEWVGEESDLHEQATWWLEAAVEISAPARVRRSRLFARSGTAVLAVDDVHVTIDGGPFGAGSGGHSHSDTLSVIARVGREEILIDPGTCDYVVERSWRDWFRGSAAHNTIRVDALDQAVPAGPFRWTQPPSVELREWVSSEEEDRLEAICRYRGVVHRRRLVFRKPHWLFVEDEIEGLPGPHLVEQFWHLGEPAAALSEHCFRIGTRTRLVIRPGPSVDLTRGEEYGWRSGAWAERSPAPVVRVYQHTTLPTSFAAAIDFAGGDGAITWAQAMDCIPSELRR